MTTKVFFAGIFTLLTLNLTGCSSTNDITDVDFQEELISKCQLGIGRWYKESMEYEKKFELNIDRSSLEFKASDINTIVAFKYSGFDEQVDQVISQYGHCTFTKHGTKLIQLQALGNRPFGSDSKPESAAPAASTAPAASEAEAAPAAR